MEVLRALAPQFECTTGHHLSAGYDPTNAIKRQIEDGAVFFELEELEGETDCPAGCVVEPDGTCEHGFESAALTLGVI